MYIYIYMCIYIYIYKWLTTVFLICLLMVCKITASGTRNNELSNSSRREKRRQGEETYINPHSFRHLSSYLLKLSLIHKYVVLEVAIVTNFGKGNHSIVRIFIKNLYA